MAGLLVLAVQNHLRLGNFATDRLAMELRFPNVLKSIRLIEVLVDCRQQNGLAVPANATIIRPHQE
jgi:hypothetical protein